MQLVSPTSTLTSNLKSRLTSLRQTHSLVEHRSRQGSRGFKSTGKVRCSGPPLQRVLHFRYTAVCPVQVVDAGSLRVQPCQRLQERGRHRRCHTCHSECCWRLGVDGKAEAARCLQHQSQAVLIAMQGVDRVGQATLTRTGWCAPQHRFYRTLTVAVDRDRLCSQSRIRCCRGRSTRVLLQRRRMLMVVVPSCVLDSLPSSCG